MKFQKATRQKVRLRMALCGPSGAGKTYSALRIATGLGGSIALIDTEHSSAALYADKFSFDTLDLTSGHPEKYCEAIELAGRAGYDVLVIDSLSHAWNGSDGALEQVSKASARLKGNSYAAWRDVTPMHDRLVRALLSYPGHVIVTMRSKMAYELQEENGRKTPVKLGMAPIQREGIEYEFTVVGDMDYLHRLVITKSRFPELADAVLDKPGEQLGQDMLRWLENGGEPTKVPLPSTAGLSETARKFMLRFEELGVPRADLEDYLGHPLEEGLTDVEQADLVTVGKAVKSGLDTFNAFVDDAKKRRGE